MTETRLATVVSAVVKKLAAQIKLIGILVGVVFAALAGISFFTPHPLATFLKLVTFAGTILMLFSMAMMILTFRKAREVVPAALLVSLAVALLSSFAAVSFAHPQPSALWTLLCLAAGGGLGILWSQTTVFFIDKNQVRMRGTVWYLAVWGLTLAVNQIVAITTARPPVVVCCLALMGAGLAIGNTAGLVVRANQAAAPLRRAMNRQHI